MKRLTNKILLSVGLIIFFLAIGFLFFCPSRFVVEDITYNKASNDLIEVELPFPGAVVGKEFSVIGKARGVWFFEASFPLKVLDEKGQELAVSFAQAEGEWMTENLVPFKGDIKIPQSYIGPATLILKKDNPSGLPEHDASISFPIIIEY